MNITTRTITMVPRVILDRAKELKHKKQYEEALKLLERNAVEAEVYEDHIEIRINSHLGSNIITHNRRMRGFRLKPFYKPGDKGGGRKKKRV